MRLGVLAFGALLTAATALSFVPSNEWWIRIFDFPRRQIAVLLVVTSGVAVRAFGVTGWRERGILAVLLGAAACQAGRTLPYTPLAAVQVEAAERCDRRTAVRLLIANVEYDNREAGALLALVRQVDPDLVLLLEPGAWWEARLRPLERDWPHVVRQPQEDTWGLLLYSRLPLIEPEVRFLVEPDIPSVRTRLVLPSGDQVWLYGLHPRPPRPGDDTDERDTELMIVAREIRSREEPSILAGDLNDVAWSRTTRRLQERADLLDPRVGRGAYATFNADLPPGFRWALDHVFLTRHFELCSLARLRHIGSDHFPLLAEVMLRAPVARLDRPPPLR